MLVPAIVTRRLELPSLGVEVLSALVDGRDGDAEALIGARLPARWPDDALSLFALRLAQLRCHPDQQPWLLRGLIERGPWRRLVGYANFHGPPDDCGRVEIGYTVLAAFRRRGYAEEAALALIGWAAAQARVSRIAASIAPGNAPSLALAAKLGFVHTGRQWDERDGEELVLERPAALR